MLTVSVALLEPLAREAPCATKRCVFRVEA